MNPDFSAKSFRTSKYQIVRHVALAVALVIAVAAGVIYENHASAAGGELDSAFNSGGAGADGNVWAVALQPDGKILIGGEFTSYNGDAAAPDKVMRLNADGSRDNTFNVGGSGANNIVRALALQQDGKIIIGGTFTGYNGDAAASDSVLRLNADGTRDNSFNSGGTGTNFLVQALAVQTDGKILIGGGFTIYNGDVAASDRIMRLNADGTRDATFNAGGAGADSTVEVLALQADGKILVGGLFNGYNGDAAASDKILRLNADGTRDTTFNAGGAGADNSVIAIAVQPNGRIIIGGTFVSYNGDAAAPDMVMRLNADGSRDTSFNVGGSGANFSIWTIALQPEGKIVIGGNFSQYNGAGGISRIMRLNADGTRDTTLAGTGANGTVASIALQQDGKIIAGGFFTQFNGISAAPDFIVRLLPATGLLAFSSDKYDVMESDGNATITLIRTGGTDNQVVAKVSLTDVTTNSADYRFTPGARDAAFNAGGGGASSSVNAVAVQPDGKILIGGPTTLTSYNLDAAAPDRIFRLNADGTLDLTFNPGGTGTDSTVFAVALQPDGKIIIGGAFSSYNGDAAASDRVMRLNTDGTRDTTFNAGGVGADGDVRALAVQPDGKILIAGTFASYNGDAAASDGIMRLNTDGTRDTIFNSGGTGATLVGKIALQADGKIIIAGPFFTYNGQPPAGVTRLNADGTRDTSFNPGGSGPGSSVSALAIQSDGKILIGGIFTSYNGDAAASDGIMRLNSDGTRDVDFNPGGGGAGGPSFTVQNVTLQPDGKILIGGGFSTYNGDAAAPDRVMRLKSDGTRDTTFNSGGAGADNTVNAMALLGNGKILIGGSFVSYNSDAAASDGIMRLDGDLFVTWPAGDATDKTIQLPIINDGVTEGNETLTLTMSLMSGGATQGEPSSSTLTIHDPNSPPTISAAGPLSRQQGSAVSNSQIATVNDAESGAGGVTITVTSANPANGVTVSNIVNTNGIVTADVVAACTAGNAFFTLTATDGNGATATAIRNVSVVTNTAPTLSYATPHLVNANSSLNVTPTTASDNGSITGYSIVSVTPALTSAPIVNSSGVVSITNAQPDGGHTITVRATDNCGATRDASFSVVVGTFRFSASAYNTTEGSGFATITVERMGDSSSPVTVSVDYSSANDGASATVPCSTANGVALSRCDFTTPTGTLNFATGETSKTFIVLISQDSYVEGPETLTLFLSNPTPEVGLASPAVATLTITDDVTEPPTNVIDDVRNFVRQHYHDFLNREADTSGLDFWSNEITSCGNDAQCSEVRHINVSAAFFLSIEFQQSGYLVERVYKVGYGDASGTSGFPSSHQLAVPVVRYNEFLRGTQRIGRGVVVLAPGWEQLLVNNKFGFILDFVNTTRFRQAFPNTMTPAEFVDKLNQNAGNVLSASERTTVINLFSGAVDSSNFGARAAAVFQVAEDTDLYNAEFNRAFVLAQYFGYLRRNPNDAPESTLDYTGYDFWFTKLNEFNGNYINAEMVKAFISSTEYRQRFGP